ncbi:hypothetical protein Tco_0751218 [Tanacetum coccineum]|uniref:Uncharacterized protein n=1 Tax=Tanacetum coccineum TaxID=301880 RepID=A0ABQ4Z480_9ASTR
MPTKASLKNSKKKVNPLLSLMDGFLGVSVLKCLVLANSHDPLDNWKPFIDPRIYPKYLEMVDENTKEKSPSRMVQACNRTTKACSSPKKFPQPPLQKSLEKEKVMYADLERAIKLCLDPAFLPQGSWNMLSRKVLTQGPVSETTSKLQDVVGWEMPIVNFVTSFKPSITSHSSTNHNTDAKQSPIPLPENHSTFIGSLQLRVARLEQVITADLSRRRGKYSGQPGSLRSILIQESERVEGDYQNQKGTSGEEKQVSTLLNLTRLKDPRESMIVMMMKDDDDDEGPSVDSNQGSSTSMDGQFTDTSRCSGCVLFDATDMIPIQKHSEQSSNDILMLDEGNDSFMEDHDNAHIPKVDKEKELPLPDPKIQCRSLPRLWP